MAKKAKPLANLGTIIIMSLLQGLVHGPLLFFYCIAAKLLRSKTLVDQCPKPIKLHIGRKNFGRLVDLHSIVKA